MDYLLYFYIYSFFGWVLETLYTFIRTRRFCSKQTLLRTPMCPVYGLGAVLMLLCLSRESGVLLIFSGGFFLASSTEYLIAAIYEEHFGVRCWDYRNHIGNLHGRVCVGFSLCWGVIAVLFLTVLHPAIESTVAGLSTSYETVLVTFLSVWVVADMKKTAAELVKFSHGEENQAEKCFWFLSKVS